MLHVRVLRACGQLQQAVQRHPTDGNAGEGKPCSPPHSRRPARCSSRRRGRGAGSPWKQKLTDVFGDLLEDGFRDQHANVPRYNTQKKCCTRFRWLPRSHPHRRLRKRCRRGLTRFIVCTSTTNVFGHTRETKKPLLADNVTSNVTSGRMTHPRYRHGRNMKTQNLQGPGELQPFRTTPRFISEGLKSAIGRTPSMEIEIDSRLRSESEDSGRTAASEICL